jgi:hypothetical protein
MARIRSIHPSACTSEKMAELSGDEERCFWRLQTHCDDEGRCEDHPRLIWAALFPLHADVSPDDVAVWLDALVEVGLLVRYVVGGKRYVQVERWHDFQKPKHPTPTKLPSPDEGEAVPRSTRVVGEGFPGSLHGGGGGGGVGVGDGVPKPAARRDVPYADEFDQFWKPYPRKVDKADALKAYQARRREGVSHEDLLAAAVHYASQRKGQEQAYTKHAATFLAKDGAWTEWLGGAPERHGERVAGDAERPRSGPYALRVPDGLVHGQQETGAA